jgi:hypothetical protein
MKETLWKNHFNFVKDMHMIYVHFIIVVIIISKKKIGGITYALSLILFYMLAI